MMGKLCLRGKKRSLGLHPAVLTHTQKHSLKQLNMSWLRPFTQNRAEKERDKGDDVKPASYHQQDFCTLSSAPEST